MSSMAACRMGFPVVKQILAKSTNSCRRVMKGEVNKNSAAESQWVLEWYRKYSLTSSHGGVSAG